MSCDFVPIGDMAFPMFVLISYKFKVIVRLEFDYLRLVLAYSFDSKLNKK